MPIFCIAETIVNYEEVVPSIYTSGNDDVSIQSLLLLFFFANNYSTL